MKTGAVIVAAGMSTRMKGFKPMLNIGNISIAQRVIATLQQAGVEHIVMVTGFNSDMLEKHLVNHNVVFLRNERYETTHMFDSACIGLRYMADQCDRVIFTPVDIPLFTAATVRALLASDAKLACPVCGGKSGHPIMIDSTLIPGILSDSGETGLQGALKRCGEPFAEILVNDRGVLYDADAPEDYEALLEYHNAQLVRPVVNVALTREKPFFDARVAMLFHQVEETGSVRTACRRMQMSYSSGWNVIRTLESQMSQQLICRTQGGSGGTRSKLTEEGKALLRRYDEFTARLRHSAETLFEESFEGIF